MNRNISLHNKIEMMLRETVVRQCADRAMHVLAAGSADSVGKWIC
jgi:hypothetical protein